MTEVEERVLVEIVGVAVCTSRVVKMLTLLSNFEKEAALKDL